MNSRNKTQYGGEESDEYTTKFSNTRGSSNQANHNLRLSPSPRETNYNDENQFEIDERWCELKITGQNLSGRSYHSMVLFKDCLYIYGGYQVDVGVLNDFYCLPVLGVASYQWYRVPSTYKDSTDQLVNNPGQRMRHTAICFQDKMYIFGGKQTSQQNNSELFSFDFGKNTWKKLENQGAKILPVDSHCVGLSDVSGESEMIVFGGFNGGSQGDFSNSVTAYNFLTSEWRILYQESKIKSSEAAPMPRAGSATAIFKSQLFVFGGGTFHTKFDDFWVFDLLACKWVQVDTQNKDIPDPRNGHSMVLYQSNFLFIFGGIMDITKQKNDVYAYDISRNLWKKVHTQTNSNHSKSPGLKEKRDRQGYDQSFDKRKFRNNKTISPIKLAARESLVEQSGPNKRQTILLTGDSKTLTGTGSVEKILNTDTNHRSPKSKFNIYNDPYIQLDTGSIQMEKNNDSYNPTKQIIENQKRAFLQQKHKLLDDLEQKDAKEKQQLRSSSPVTEAMMNSLNKIGNQTQEKQNMRTIQLTTEASSPSPRQTKGDNIFFENGQKSRVEQMGAYFDSSHNLLIGQKPCARDGQSVCLVENRMMIYGGDRHLMSLNDLYFFDLDLTISKHLSN